MSSLLPFLIHCSDRRCNIPSPASSSPELVRTLGQNRLVLRDDTLCDGNCGVHAFYLSLADIADRNHAIKKLSAWKELSKVKAWNTQLITYLRKVAVKWMKANADVEVWEGMRHREVALRMSHLQELYDDHLERMWRDKEWVGAWFETGV